MAKAATGFGGWVLQEVLCLHFDAMSGISGPWHALYPRVGDGKSWV